MKEDLMIDMIREHFEAKTDYSWKDYPIRIDSYKSQLNNNQAETIFIWYYITIGKESKESLNFIAIDKADYEYRLAYRESAARDNKLNSLLKGSFLKRFF